MKTERQIPQRTYGVPLDMLMDVLKIVMRHNLPQHIAAISAKENILLLNVKFPFDNAFSTQAKENIETLLSDYGYFSNGSPTDRSFGDVQNIEDQF